MTDSVGGIVDTVSGAVGDVGEAIGGYASGVGDYFYGTGDTGTNWLAGSGVGDWISPEYGQSPPNLLFGGAGTGTGLYDLSPEAGGMLVGEAGQAGWAPFEVLGSDMAGGGSTYAAPWEWGFDPTEFQFDASGMGVSPQVTVPQLAGNLASRLNTGSALQAGAGLIAGLGGAYAARQAANVQANAAKQAASGQQAMFNQVRADLLPWQAAGIKGTGTLTDFIGLGLGQDPTQSRLLRKFDPTMAELEATPGYQWSLGQGLKSVQSSAAARGLGSSGASYRGAIDYATGLAGTTYQQQLQNELAQRQLQFNMLQALSEGGRGAAAQSGQLGTTGQAAAGQFLTSAGAAQAGGYAGMANNLGGSLMYAASRPGLMV